MAFRSIIEEVPDNLKRTFLGTFDFAGRSTRTELLVFLFVPPLLIGLTLLILDALFLDLDFDATWQLQDAVTILLTVPIPALLVRRLHDQDRTGWWALLLLAAFVFEAVDDDRSLSILGLAQSETPWWLSLTFFATIIALWGFSLWPASEGANRYGPNPRLDPTEMLA